MSAPPHACAKHLVRHQYTESARFIKPNFHLESLCVALLLLVDLLCNSLRVWQKQWQMIFTLQSFSPRFNNIIFFCRRSQIASILFITNYMTKIRTQIFQISERKSFKTVWFSGFLLKNIKPAIYFYAYFYLYGV